MGINYRDIFYANAFEMGNIMKESTLNRHMGKGFEYVHFMFGFGAGSDNVKCRLPCRLQETVPPWSPPPDLSSSPGPS